MSPESLNESESRQVELKEFIFPNNHPFDLVLKDMHRILSHRFINPRIEQEVLEEENMGTLWHVEVSFEARKPRNSIEEMELDEIEMELLVRDHLPEEF